jgi:hypothetical protein
LLHDKHSGTRQIESKEKTAKKEKGGFVGRLIAVDVRKTDRSLTFLKK